MERGTWLLVGLRTVAVFGMVAWGIVTPGNAEANARRHIVVFEPTFVNGPAQQALVERFGGVNLRELDLINGMAVLLPAPAVAALSGTPGVLRVDVDAVVHASPKPDWAGGGSNEDTADPLEEIPWGVDRIDAEFAWPVARGSGIRVAIIDTGIDQDHPDLAINIAGGINFVGKGLFKDPNPTKWDDDNGHGTHVAGIVAAADNDIGVVGVAPEASLYGVKVLDRNGSGYTSGVIAGIQWAADNGMDVANLSLGTDQHVQSLADACDLAAAQGLILVAAAGNSGGSVSYPAGYGSVIGIAATDSTDARASFSSFGTAVAVAAPGVGIKSTYRGGGYATLSGTSMAAPHVSGLLALDLGAPLCATADDLPPVGIDIYTGCGLVDAGEAITGSETPGDDLP